MDNKGCWRGVVEAGAKVQGAGAASGRASAGRRLRAVVFLEQNSKPVAAVHSQAGPSAGELRNLSLGPAITLDAAQRRVLGQPIKQRHISWGAGSAVIVKGPPNEVQKLQLMHILQHSHAVGHGFIRRAQPAQVAQPRARGQPIHIHAIEVAALQVWQAGKCRMRRTGGLHVHIYYIQHLRKRETGREQSMWVAQAQPQPSCEHNLSGTPLQASTPRTLPAATLPAAPGSAAHQAGQLRQVRQSGTDSLVAVMRICPIMQYTQVLQLCEQRQAGGHSRVFKIQPCKAAAQTGEHSQHVWHTV